MSDRLHVVCVDWFRLLEAAGLAPRARSLPTAATCPQCGQRELHLFYTPLYPAKWGRCAACGLAGSGMELAAIKMNLPIDVATLKLGRKNLFQLLGVCGIEVAARDLAIMAARSGRMRRVWKDSQEILLKQKHPVEYDRLKTKLRLNCHLDLQSWSAGMGRFIGGSGFVPIRRAYRFETESVEGKAGEMPLPNMAGTGWGYLLVSPLQSLPGEVGGFYVMSNFDEAAGRFPLYGCQHNQKQWARSDRFLGFDPVLDSKPAAVIFITDLLLVLQLQARQFQVSNTPLPLMGWIPANADVSLTNWAGPPGIRKVLWSPEAEAAIVLTAARTSSDLCLGFDWAEGLSTLDYAYKNTAEDVSRRVLAEAKPWLMAVDRYIVSAENEPKLETALLRWAENAWLWRQVRDGVSPEALARLDRLVPARVYPATFEFARGVFLAETSSGIERYKLKKAQISNDRVTVLNAQVRIHQLSTDGQGEGCWCEGEVIKDGHTASFLAPSSVFESQLEFSTWIRNFGLTQGLGPITANTRGLQGFNWLDVLCRLHPPKMAREISISGWKPDKELFQFPAGVVLSSGEIRLSGSALSPSNSPGERVLMPAEHDTDLWDVIANAGRSGSVIFGLIAFVVARLLAPKFSAARAPLLIVCPNAPRKTLSSLARLMRDIGCPRETDMSNDPNRQTVWPVWRGETQGPRWRAGLACGDVMMANLTGAYQIYVERECGVLMMRSEFDYPLWMEPFVRKAVPDAISRIASNDYLLPTDCKPTFYRAVTAAMARWITLNREQYWLRNRLFHAYLCACEDNNKIMVFGQLVRKAVGRDKRVLEGDTLILDRFLEQFPKLTMESLAIIHSLLTAERLAKVLDRGQWRIKVDELYQRENKRRMLYRFTSLGSGG